ncbi:hypothetical protein MLD38_010999 [Melastoma candidum]|uniref:Uncharacterized protein n=1 Tax=Melastoma candidum TaxID=119954 RepID=A0ACB9R2Z3_9MYRT|nr:hypothetical protein MLD38_010999 [Melastoma candidum]
MVTTKNDQPVYGLKLSSVGPAKVTGSDAIYHPEPMDLAMKLHYLRGVYYFSAKSVEGLTIPRIKESMFSWFNDYYQTCGRFRRSESGRPYIKCNDCGTRFIEGKSGMTVDEWLEADDGSLVKMLASQQVIGPEMGFSPPFLIQVTHFKCGGMAMGFSWAHVLGDAFSASQCFNSLGRLLSGHVIRNNPGPKKPISTNGKAHNEIPVRFPSPLSIKQVGAGCDHWVCPGLGNGANAPLFESICVALWQMVARVREDGQDEPRVVTVVSDDESGRRVHGKLSNSQRISIARAGSPVAVMDPKELLDVLVGRKGEENKLIEEAVEKDNGMGDFVLYGANLTFVNLEDGDFYELKLHGHKPMFVNYVIQSLGDQGVVLVLPGTGDEGNDGGRVVTVVLPEKELVLLKADLKKKVTL